MARAYDRIIQEERKRQKAEAHVRPVPADTDDALRRGLEEARARGFDAFFEGQTKPWHFIVSDRQDEEKLNWQRRLDAAAEPVIAALQARIAELEAEVNELTDERNVARMGVMELQAENARLLKAMTEA